MILLEKMIDFDTFTKIPLEFERFGQIKCCQKHLKVGQSPINRQIWQSPINRQIWSHCSSPSTKEILAENIEPAEKNPKLLPVMFWSVHKPHFLFYVDKQKCVGIMIVFVKFRLLKMSVSFGSKFTLRDWALVSNWGSMRL